MRFFFLAVLLVASVGFAQSTDVLDKKYGFRDVSFGSPVSGSWVKHSALDDGTSFYSRKDERLSVGDVRLSEITFVAYQGKVVGVMFSTQKDARLLLETLTAAYGTPNQSNRFIPRFSWDGRRVTMTYTLDEHTGSARVMMVSIKYFEEKRQEEAAKANKATNDL